MAIAGGAKLTVTICSVPPPYTEKVLGSMVNAGSLDVMLNTSKAAVPLLVMVTGKVLTSVVMVISKVSDAGDMPKLGVPDMLKLAGTTISGVSLSFEVMLMLVR